MTYLFEVGGAFVEQLRKDGVLARVDFLAVERPPDVALVEQHSDDAVAALVQPVDDDAHPFQVKADEGLVGRGLVLLCVFPAGVEQREVFVDVVEVMARHREWRVAIACCLQQRRFDYAADAAVAVPEGMDCFVIKMDQRGADQRGHLVLEQAVVPFDQLAHEQLHVAAVLGRLVAAAVGLVADIDRLSLGVVAEHAGDHVRIGNVARDVGVDAADEVEIQTPAGRARGFLRVVVGRLDVNGAALLGFLDLRRVELEHPRGFFFAQRAAFDSVGAEHAADHDLFFELPGHLVERRLDEELMRVFHPLQGHDQVFEVDADLEGEGAEAVGFDPELAVWQRFH